MAENKQKSRGLGRGLSALMADVNEVSQPAASVDAPRRPDMVVPIENIAPNPDQPRRRFDPEHLEDLANSIREKGVIQPLIVREKPGDAGKYEIVAGERRWRASQKAQLHELPVIVRELNDTEVLEIAIIENIQRSDLNPVEEAAGYRQLMDRFGHTQDALSKALGKSRSHIANLMRLLNLSPDIQEMLEERPRKLRIRVAKAVTSSSSKALPSESIGTTWVIFPKPSATGAPTCRLGLSSR